MCKYDGIQRLVLLWRVGLRWLSGVVGLRSRGRAFAKFRRCCKLRLSRRPTNLSSAFLFALCQLRLSADKAIEWVIGLFIRLRNLIMKCSRHPSRVNQTFVFFFAWIFLNIHLLHNRQLFHSSSCLHFVCFSEAVTARGAEEARILSHRFSNRSNF